MALARSAKKVIASRGKTHRVFDMVRDPPDDETLAQAILGPTGNLRAPAIRRGHTLLIGFHSDIYRDWLG